MSNSRYHTFLSHHGADKPAVEQLAERLQKEGITCWLDSWDLIPGEPWMPVVERALKECDCFCVCIGPSGMGPWQHEEMRAAIARRVKDTQFRVIPVVLPGGRREQRSHLPSFLVEHTWVEFHESLDEENAFHRLKCGILGKSPRPGATLESGQCPYPGLQTFQVEEAPWFFGRQVEIEWLLNKLRTNFNTPQENRFLAIVGASGSGKSSLARAGLLAALSQEQLPDSSHWPLIICRPGYDPLKQLALALWHHPQIKEAAGDYGELIERLANQPQRLHLTIDAALYGRPETHRAVLLIDQFEEIFTLCGNEQHRRALIDNLLEAARVRDGRTLVVITLRADFYGRCGTFPRLAAALSDHQELVGPMQPKHLRQAIAHPAQLAGCELEPGLTEMLLEGMENQPGALPLLQHALRQLWLRRSGRRLTVAAYRDIGRLEGALDRYANELFEHLSDEQRDICRRIFLRLVQPGEGSEDTKRRAARSELGTDAPVDEVLNRLADARLITTSGGEPSGDNFVDISHEALIRGWQRLGHWVNDNRESIRIQQRLTAAASEWLEHGRDEAYLYRGARLAEADEWSQTKAAELTPLERAFLETSTQSRVQLRRREVRRTQLMTAVAIIAAVFASVATILYFNARSAWNEAEMERDKANRLAEKNTALAEVERQARRYAERQLRVARANGLVAESRLHRQKKPLHSLSLAVDAVKTTYLFNKEVVPLTHQNLRDALSSVGGRPLVAADAVSCMTVGPKQRWLARGHHDGVVRLWDLASEDPLRAPISLLGLHGQSVECVSFDSAGRWLVSGSHDGTAHVWNLTSDLAAEKPFVLRGHSQGLRSVAVGPQSRCVVTVSDDRTARLWDLETPDPTETSRTFAVKSESVGGAAISPNGRWLVVLSNAETSHRVWGSLRLWDLSTTESDPQPVVLSNEGENVQRFLLDPKGRWLIADTEATVKLYDLSLENPAEGKYELADRMYAACLVVDPQGKWLLVGNYGKAPDLWNLTDDDPSQSSTSLQRPEGSIEAANFDAQGQQLAAVVKDTICIWKLDELDAAPTLLKGHTAEIEALQFSPDGRLLASGGDDHVVRVWNLWKSDPAKDVKVLRGHDEEVNTAIVGIEGRWLVTDNHYSGKPRLWDLTYEDLSSSSAVVLRGHSWGIPREGAPDEPPEDPRGITAIAIGPQGRWLLTGGADGTGRLWDLTAVNPSQDAIVFEHGGEKTRVAISPDGRWAAIGGGNDDDIYVYDLMREDPSAAPIVLKGHENEVSALAFTPNSRRLLSTSWDRTARIWDFNEAERTSIVLAGHELWVRDLAIGPNGRWLATGGDDKMVRLWDLSAQDPAASCKVLTGHTDTVASVAIDPAGRWLATGSWDNTTRLWDLSADNPGSTVRVLQGHDRSVWTVVFGPKSRWLATGSWDGTVRLWDVTSDDPAANSMTFDANYNVAAVAFDPNGRWLAAGADDDLVYLWDLSAKDPTAGPVILRGHERDVTCLVTDSQGRLVSGSDDNTARVWTLDIQKLLEQAHEIAGANGETSIPRLVGPPVSWPEKDKNREFDGPPEGWPQFDVPIPD